MPRVSSHSERIMPSREWDSDVNQQAVRRAVAVGVAIVALALVLWTGSSSYTRIKPGEIGVIKNNVTGNESEKTQEGIIVHLPWGLTDVFVLDRGQKTLTLEKPDAVTIKTVEGANVDAKVELTYSLLPLEGTRAVKTLGLGQGALEDKRRVEGIVYSYVRTKIRDALGKLDLELIADQKERTARVEEARTDLNGSLKTYGVEIHTLNASDWDYDDQYEEKILQRIEADQREKNLRSEQDTNRQRQATSIAEANRLKSNATTEAEGDKARDIIAKEAWAIAEINRTQGTAYKVRKDADAKYVELDNQAKGLEVELLNRALGIEALAAAYAQGGLGLVKEVLARKLIGATITGRPYTHDSTPQRIVLQEEALGAAAAREKSR